MYWCATEELSLSWVDQCRNEFMACFEAELATEEGGDDHIGAWEVVCPLCAHEHPVDWFDEVPAVWDPCEGCGVRFRVSVERSMTFSTSLVHADEGEG